MPKTPIKIALFTLYFLLVAAVFGKLFFEDQFNAFLAYFRAFKPVSATTMTIGYSEPLISLSPLANDTGSRSRLYHIYEGLTRVNKDLAVEPGLAISYGSINDLVWEFRLRPGVTFHNGASLTLDDVIFSIFEAKNNPQSGVRDLASAISNIEKIDTQIFRIETERPDPLLLQKLSQILIVSADADLNNAPGTGPYKIAKNEEGTLQLKIFSNYWGGKPAFENVNLMTFANKEEKIAALQNHTVDIVSNVPVEAARAFNFPKFQLRQVPSLEVNFLMFHLDKMFKERNLRQAVALALDIESLAKLTQGFSRPAEQFVGNGIFGFDPGIPKREYNPERAAELVKEVSNFERVSVTLDLPKGLEIFGANIKEYLKKAGIDTELVFLPPAELSRKITSRKSEFYFFGWKSDLGDSGDFLTAVIHSPGSGFGQFNGGNYRSAEADRAIELSQEIVSPAIRLEKLRQVMKKITVDDIIGVPLFTPEVLYGVSDSLEWEPRVDGFILAQEVKM